MKRLFQFQIFNYNGFRLSNKSFSTSNTVRRKLKYPKKSLAEVQERNKTPTSNLNKEIQLIYKKLEILEHAYEKSNRLLSQSNSQLATIKIINLEKNYSQIRNKLIIQLNSIFSHKVESSKYRFSNSSENTIYKANFIKENLTSYFRFENGIADEKFIPFEIPADGRAKESEDIIDNYENLLSQRIGNILALESTTSFDELFLDSYINNSYLDNVADLEEDKQVWKNPIQENIIVNNISNTNEDFGVFMDEDDNRKSESVYNSTFKSKFFDYTVINSNPENKMKDKTISFTKKH